MSWAPCWTCATPPELVFEIDHSIEEGAHISALIEQLHDKDTGSEA